MKTFVIAEAGVNHNGSLELALQLVDAAADAGVDAVKFQTFKSELVISAAAPKAAYQKATTGESESQLDMVRKLELDAAAHARLLERCRERKIPFLSTPFDLGSVDLLVSLGVPLLKVPSGEVTHARLLRKVAQTGLPVLMSTGMCTLGDIEAALSVLAAGYLGETDPVAAFRSDAGQAVLHDKVTLLHCTTEYPAPLADVNLHAMATMRQAFGLPVGYSDHSDGIAVALAAVALGACVIEKHFTLDRSMPGPDHQASLEPSALRAMVEGIRAVELALGNPCKRPSLSELKNLPIARRSLVAARRIRKGELFTAENMAAKRPGGGVSPLRDAEYLGKPAGRDYEPDEPL